MNYISFSLYGDKPKYTRGMVSNAKLAKIFYKNWRVIVYHDSSVPADILAELRTEGCELVDMTNKQKMGRMFWRFLINEHSGCTRYLIRDADSRLSEREACAVAEWMVSGKPFHIMRDHEGHAKEMMGGMWGGTRKFISNLNFIIEKWPNKTDDYDNDQAFLKACIWPFIKNMAHIHDSRKPETDFPQPRGERFVGEVFNEKDEPVAWGTV